MSDRDIAGPPVAGNGALAGRRLVLLMAVSANLFGNLNFSGVNVVAPAIEAELGLSATGIVWLTLSCMLLMAAVSAPVARLADILGRRRLTILGVWVAIVGFLGGALAPDPWTLFASRALTGVGLSTFFTTSMTMIAASYPKEERGRVFGLAIGAVYVSLSVGPVIAGAFSQAFGWRPLFGFWALMLVPTLALAYMVEKEPPVAKGESLDWKGVPLWAFGVTLFFAGLASLTTQRTALAVAALVAGALLIAAFVWRGSRSESPLLDLSLFTESRRFSLSSLAAYVSYVSSFSIALLMSLYFQYSKGLSPFYAGLALVVQPLVQAALTPLAGRLSDRHDPGLIASLGLSVILCGMLFFVFSLGGSTPVWVDLIPMSLCGAGFALFSAPNSNAIMSAVPPPRLGQASGVITITRLSGQLSSMALTSMVFALVIGPGEITPDKYPSFIKAARILFLAFSPLCVLAIFASLARGRPKAS
ncbi:MAG: MFS transporter [Deltaproteobacteria bacterium]|nr:MFS transporter [Deltaproteobacteria bacterium]